MFLSSQCFFSELTDDLLSTCQPFSCGNEDLDDFFKNDATRYAYYLMGKSYCFRKNDDPVKIVCAFTVSNDSIRIYDLPRSRKDYMKSLTHHEKPLRRYPGILIGRLGVNKDFCGKGIGSEVIDFIKGWFMSHDNKSGCRFVIVDAINAPEVILKSATYIRELRPRKAVGRDGKLSATPCQREFLGTASPVGRYGKPHHRSP